MLLFAYKSIDVKSLRVLNFYRAYISTKMYREIKLRGGFIQNKILNILPLEVVNSTTPGVWNLSAEQGNVGIFIITNIRIVWFADMNYQFNVSLPYLALDNVSIKPSKFGPTLVIISKESNHGYILGFRVDPIEKLHIFHKEISSLKSAYDKRPILGIEYTFEYESVKSSNAPEDYNGEIQERDDSMLSIFSLYSAEREVIQRKPICNLHLGLAIEETQEGSSTSNLWTLMFAT